MQNIQTKICYKCKIEKPLSDFHKDKSKPDGHMCLCIKCKREYRISPFYKERERQLEKTPRYKARVRKYQTTDKGWFAESKIRHIVRSPIQRQLHTLTFDELCEIKSKQNNKCAICGLEHKLEPDCIIPLCVGGSLSFDNVQLVCRRCNTKKNRRIYSGLSGNRWRKLLLQT